MRTNLFTESTETEWHLYVSPHNPATYNSTYDSWTGDDILSPIVYLEYGYYVFSAYIRSGYSLIVDENFYVYSYSDESSWTTIDGSITFEEGSGIYNSDTKIINGITYVLNYMPFFVGNEDYWRINIRDVEGVIVSPKLERGNKPSKRYPNSYQVYTVTKFYDDILNNRSNCLLKEIHPNTQILYECDLRNCILPYYITDYTNTTYNTKEQYNIIQQNYITSRHYMSINDNGYDSNYCLPELEDSLNKWTFINNINSDQLSVSKPIWFTINFNTQNNFLEDLGDNLYNYFTSNKFKNLINSITSPTATNLSYDLYLIPRLRLQKQWKNYYINNNDYFASTLITSFAPATYLQKIPIQYETFKTIQNNIINYNLTVPYGDIINCDRDGTYGNPTEIYKPYINVTRTPGVNGSVSWDYGSNYYYLGSPMIDNNKYLKYGWGYYYDFIFYLHITGINATIASKQVSLSFNGTFINSSDGLFMDEYEINETVFRTSPIYYNAFLKNKTNTIQKNIYIDVNETYNRGPIFIANGSNRANLYLWGYRNTEDGKATYEIFRTSSYLKFINSSDDLEIMSRKGGNDIYISNNYNPGDTSSWDTSPPSSIYDEFYFDNYFGVYTSSISINDYFTIKSLENNNAIYWKASSSNYTKTISISTDNGSTWTDKTSSTSGTLLATLNTGGKLLIRGTNSTYSNGNYYNYFTSSGNFVAEGNIMSLAYGSSFYEYNNGSKTTLPSIYIFKNLFSGCTKLTGAANLILPATTLAPYCYAYMFNGCTSLTTAPELPATTLAPYCYAYMFKGCTSLTTAPELPATTLANYCYYYMFQGCSALTTAPELPATTLATNCYGSMFQGCSALTTAPELPATTLASSCYNNMFVGCTSLTTAPELPATTLATYCYQYMFYNCTSLTTAPELPATTLASICYNNMFFGCTSLTTAPELPATTLATNCYGSMFQGCTSLTTAPELPATTLTNSCYQGMFYNCTSLTTAPELPATTLISSCYSSMFYNCTSLTTAPELPATTLAEYCYNYMFYGCTSLNYIKCWAKTSASGCTTNWVYNVASTGIFVGHALMSWTYGAGGIPNNWEVQLFVPTEEGD